MGPSHVQLMFSGCLRKFLKEVKRGSVFVNVFFTRGHGTMELDGEVVATLCGVVERVNKLVYVRPHRARFECLGLKFYLFVLFSK